MIGSVTTVAEQSELTSPLVSSTLGGTMNTKEFLDLFGKDHLFSAYDYQKKMKPIGNIKDIKELRSLNRKGYCAYFAVNSFSKKTRNNKNIRKVRAIWVDDDNPRKKPRSKWPLPPSIVISTSKGKYQYYWLTKTKEYDEFALVMQTMVDTHGNDKGVKDLARVLRLPGFNHNKDLNNSQRVKIIGGSFKTHTWETIKIAFPPSKELKSSTKSNGKYNKKVAKNAIMESDDYHGSLRDRAMELANRRLDTEEIIAILQQDMQRVPEEERDKRWEDRISEEHLHECASSAVKKYESEDHEEEISESEVVHSPVYDTEYVFGGKLKKKILAPRNTVIGEITRAIMKSWWKPNLMVASLSARAFVAYLAGGNYRGSTGDRINFQQIAIGDSGSGKDPLISSSPNLIQLVFKHDKKNMGMLLKGIVDEAGSQEGLDDRIRSLESKQDLLFVKDEIGELLSRATGGDQVKAGILNYILKMYTKSDGISNERAKARKKDQKDSEMLYAPHFIVSAATTPDLIVDGLNASHIGTGLMSRVMLFNVDGYVEQRVKEKGELKISEKTIVKLRRIIDTSIMSQPDMFSMPSARVYNPKVVMFEDEVVSYCYSESLHDDNRKGEMRAVWNRRVPNAKKYAMVEAISENPDKPVVTMEIMERSMIFVTNSCEYTIRLFEGNVGENLHDIASKEILRILLKNEEKYKGKWVKRQTLTNSRKIKKLKGANDLNLLLNNMVQSGQIEHNCGANGNRGRPKNLYRILL